MKKRAQEERAVRTAGATAGFMKAAVTLAAVASILFIASGDVASPSTALEPFAESGSLLTPCEAPVILFTKLN